MSKYEKVYFWPNCNSLKAFNKNIYNLIICLKLKMSKIPLIKPLKFQKINCRFSIIRLGGAMANTLAYLGLNAHEGFV